MHVHLSNETALNLMTWVPTESNLSDFPSWAESHPGLKDSTDISSEVKAAWKQLVEAPCVTQHDVLLGRKDRAEPQLPLEKVAACAFATFSCACPPLQKTVQFHEMDQTVLRKLQRWLFRGTCLKDQ